MSFLECDHKCTYCNKCYMDLTYCDKYYRSLTGSNECYKKASGCESEVQRLEFRFCLCYGLER